MREALPILWQFHHFDKRMQIPNFRSAWLAFALSNFIIQRGDKHTDSRPVLFLNNPQPARAHQMRTQFIVWIALHCRALRAPLSKASALETPPRYISICVYTWYNIACVCVLCIYCMDYSTGLEALRIAPLCSGHCSKTFPVDWCTLRRSTRLFVFTKRWCNRNTNPVCPTDIKLTFNAFFNIRVTQTFVIHIHRIPL